MEIRVTVESAGVERHLLELRRDQVPFATSLALNNTGKAVQSAQQETIRRNFKIRRTWVLQGVKIARFSTKARLVVTIMIDRARDFLDKFEEGGIKRPRGKHLAIPNEVRRTKSDIVGKAQRPRSFGFVFFGRGTKATIYKGNRRTFLMAKPDGSGGIFQRVGRRGGSRLKKLYSFTRDARIAPMLHFHDVARRVVSRVFPEEFRKAFAQALATARRR